MVGRGWEITYFSISWVEYRGFYSYPQFNAQSNSQSLNLFLLAVLQHGNHNTHAPTGISLETDLMEIPTNTLPVDLCTTMVLVCAHLGITNIQISKRATSAPDTEVLRTKFQKIVTPVLRKRLFTTPLMEVVNASTRIYTTLKLNHQTGTVT